MKRTTVEEGSEIAAIDETRAPLGAITDTGAESTSLDAEDKAVRERYDAGKISRAELMVLFKQKRQPVSRRRSTARTSRVATNSLAQTDLA